MLAIEQTSSGSVVAQLVTHLLTPAREARVKDVRIGLGYTAVMLDNGSVGLAFTFRERGHGGCSVFHGMRPLATRPASDLLLLLESPDAIEAGVGLACANALANQDHGAYLDGDVLDLLDLRPDDDVGMVGLFGPLVSTIQQRVRSLTVFEQVLQPSGWLRPSEEAQTALPRCQVALITATSIINHTVDDLLKAAAGCREVVVLGASAPLLAAAFCDANVTMLSGVIAKEPTEVLRVVSEGGGTREFGPHVRKVTLKRG